MDEALRLFVWERAAGRCEYCRLHQDEYEFQTFHVEHIIAKQHGGPDHPVFTEKELGEFRSELEGR